MRQAASHPGIAGPARPGRCPRSGRHRSRRAARRPAEAAAGGSRQGGRASRRACPPASRWPGWQCRRAAARRGLPRPPPPACRGRAGPGWGARWARCWEDPPMASAGRPRGSPTARSTASTTAAAVRGGAPPGVRRFAPRSLWAGRLRAGHGPPAQLRAGVPRSLRRGVARGRDGCRMEELRVLPSLARDGQQRIREGIERPRRSRSRSAR